LSAKAEQTLVNYFRNELKGKHHGTLYIPIPAGFGQQVEAEFKEIEVGIQEGSFTEYTKENRQEILMVHRVPPGKVGIYQNSNLAVSRDADKTFKEQVCRPEQRRVEKKMNKMISEFTENFKLKFLEADIIDADISSRIHDRYLRTQVLTPNDVLTELGRPTRPDGSEPLPYEKGKNEGGPGQKTSDGARPSRTTPADTTNQRKERGQAQDGGRPSNDPARVRS
jgi:capsid portal protein